MLEKMVAGQRDLLFRDLEVLQHQFVGARGFLASVESEDQPYQSEMACFHRIRGSVQY